MIDGWMSEWIDGWMPVLMKGTRLPFVETFNFQPGIARCRNGTRLLFVETFIRQFGVAVFGLVIIVQLL